MAATRADLAFATRAALGTIACMPLQSLLLPPTRFPGLRDYQAQVAMALLRGVTSRAAPTFTVMFPRQAGKNEVSAALVAGLLRTYALAGGSVIICAPTLSPQAAISLERTLRAGRSTDRLVEGQGRIVLDRNRVSVGRATATFLSASREAHVAGHTASIALIADEAQDIDPEWFDRQFRPMAASTAAPTVMFGTPWDGETLLERAVAANREADALERGEAFMDFNPRHYEVSWREVARVVPAYGDYVRAERERLGERHPLFLTQYALRTVEGGGRLLSVSQLRAIEGPHPRLPAPMPGQRYVAGLDFAGEGAHADATVLTIARVSDGRCEVVAHKSWKSQPFECVIEDLGQIFALWQPARVCADATGMGAPLCARLAPQLGSRLEPFTFSGSSKSELGYALIAAAGTGRLLLYADDGSPESTACRAELRACRASHAPGGLLRWEAPSDEHDDYVASLALCLRAAEHLPRPRVARGRG